MNAPVESDAIITKKAIEQGTANLISLRLTANNEPIERTANEITVQNK